MTVFDRVKLFYELKWATKDDVGQYLTLGAITPEEYELIVGEPYVEILG